MRQVAITTYKSFLLDAYDRAVEEMRKDGCGEDEIPPPWLDEKHYIIANWPLQDYPHIQVFHLNEAIGGNLVDEFLVFPDGAVYSTESEDFI